MENENAVKQPSLLVALLPVAVLAGLLWVWIQVLDEAPHIPLVITTIVATFIAIRLGHTWKAIEERMIATISHSM